MFPLVLLSIKSHYCLSVPPAKKLGGGIHVPHGGAATGNEWFCRRVHELLRKTLVVSVIFC